MGQSLIVSADPWGSGWDEGDWQVGSKLIQGDDLVGLRFDPDSDTSVEIEMDPNGTIYMLTDGGLKYSGTKMQYSNDGGGSWDDIGSGGGTPAGADTNIQFNDGGSFGGDSGLTFLKASDVLYIAGNIGIGSATPVANLDIVGDVFVSEHIAIGTTSPSASFRGIGDIYATSGIKAMEGLYSEAVAYGAGLEIQDNSLVVTYTNAAHADATLTASTKIITDSHATFTDAYIGQFLKVIGSTPDFTGATGEITEVLTGTTLVLSFATAGADTIVDATGMSFVIYPHPRFFVGDNGAIHASIGVNEDAKFGIDIDNGLGFHGVYINDVAGVDQHQALTVDSDTKDFDGIVGLNVAMRASEASTNNNVVGVGLGINTDNYTNANLSFIDIVKIGLGTNNDVDGIHIQGLDPDEHILHIGQPNDVERAYYDNGDGTTTDVTTAFTSQGTEVTLFENDNSIIYVANETEEFTFMGLSFSTEANRNINAEYYYCNGDDSWKALPGVTDTTNGCKTSGSISFPNPGDRGLCDEEMDSTPFADTTDRAYIAIKRTRNNWSGDYPIENLVSIGGASYLYMDSYGTKPIGSAGAPYTCDASKAGMSYYDTSASALLWCDGATWNEYAETEDITIHNNLGGLQGGVANEYYHLTASEQTELNGWLDNVTLGADGAITTPVGVTSEALTVESNIVDFGDVTDNYVLTFDSGTDTWAGEAGGGGGGGDFADGGEAGGADRTLGNTDNYDLGFLTNNTNRLQLQNDGNMGIGTNAPVVDLVSMGSQQAFGANFAITDDGTSDLLLDATLNDNLSTTNVIDSSPTSNDGTCSVDTDTVSVGGLITVGTALALDATNDQVVFTDNAAYDVDDFSLAVWVEPETLAVGHFIFAKYNTSGNREWAIRTGAADSGKIRFITSNNGTTLGTVLTDAAHLSNGDKTFIVCTYEEGVAGKIYIDGSLVATSGSASATLINGTGNITITGYDGVTTDVSRFDGTVDRPMFWGRVISQDEITAYYNSDSGTETQLKAPINSMVIGGTGDYNSTYVQVETEGGLSLVTRGKLLTEGEAWIMGNMGIGTIAPTNPITLSGNMNVIGNIGIGSASPDTPLDIAGSTSLDGGVIINDSSADVDIRFESDINIAAFKMQGSDGNIGMGTTAPVSLLHVTSATNPNVQSDRWSTETAAMRNAMNIFHKTTGNMADGFGVYFTLGIGDGGLAQAQLARVGGQRDTADNEGALVLYAGTDGSEEFMRISHLGNVGIGTTTPTYLLEVDGTLQADDYYSGDGTQGMTDTCADGTDLVIKDGLVVSCS